MAFAGWTPQWENDRVTLVLSVHSRDSLWLVVDRRLSRSGGRPRDDAVKVMVLERTDGVGLLGYAGLGATPKGTQPSEWMSAVLRGRGGLTFEQALGVLSDAANRELPEHLARMSGGVDGIVGHTIVIPAFVRGVGPRLYTIDNVFNSQTRQHRYRFTRHVGPEDQGSMSPRVGLAGTGGIYLHQKRKLWARALLSLVNAHDRGKVSDYLIADQLARLSYMTHQAVPRTVGPRCIVVWRRRPDDRRARPGGGHRFYTGVDRDRETFAIPTIGNGMDVQALVGVLMKDFQQRVAIHGFGEAAFDVDHDEMNRLLAELPHAPDEKLQ